MNHSSKPTFTNIIQKGASVPKLTAVPSDQVRVLGGASVPRIQQIGGGGEKNIATPASESKPIMPTTK